MEQELKTAVLAHIVTMTKPALLHGLTEDILYIGSDLYCRYLKYAVVVKSFTVDNDYITIKYVISHSMTRQDRQLIEKLIKVVEKD